MINLLKAKSYKLKACAGFTLLETIIYIALFSAMASFAIVVFFQLIAGEEAHRNRVEVDTEANFIMQKLAWALTGATEINEPAVNATGTVLSVNKFNYGQNPIVFDTGSFNLRVSKAGSAPVLLGSRRIFVNEFVVEHLPAVVGATEGVKITLTVVSSNIARPQASTTLKNTIYLK